MQYPGALGLELVPKLKGGRTAWNFFKVLSEQKHCVPMSLDSIGIAMCCIFPVKRADVICYSCGAWCSKVVQEFPVSSSLHASAHYSLVAAA